MRESLISEARQRLEVLTDEEIESLIKEITSERLSKLHQLCIDLGTIPLK